MRRRYFLVQATAGAMTCLATGCGTLLHKERINRPQSRDLDWRIVAFNGLGLAFFFVPGIIAFVVDFHTGAIYLPPDYAANRLGAVTPTPLEEGTTAPPTGHLAQKNGPDLPQPATPSPAPLHVVAGGAVQLHKVAIKGERIDQAEIERRIGDYAGHPIRLDAPTVRVSPMKQLEDFSTHRYQHDTDPSFGMSVRRFFRRLYVG